MPGMPLKSVRSWSYGALTTIGGMLADRHVKLRHGTGEAGWDDTGIAASTGATLLADRSFGSVLSVKLWECEIIFVVIIL